MKSIQEEIKQHATLENPCHCMCHRDGDEDPCKKCNPNSLSSELEEKIREIMQNGFDIAMGGDVFLSPEENKFNQEKAYNKAIQESSKVLSQLFKSKWLEMIDEIHCGDIDNPHNKPEGTYTEGFYDSLEELRQQISKEEI